MSKRRKWFEDTNIIVNEKLRKLPEKLYEEEPYAGGDSSEGEPYTGGDSSEEE